MHLFSVFRQKYAPLPEANENLPTLTDFRFFFVSPLQTWLNSLISRVRSSGILEDDWLPCFSYSSSHLRAMLRKPHQTRLAFLCRREIIGMLVLGAVLEIFRSSLTLSAPLLLHRLLLEPQRGVLASTLVIVSFLATLTGCAKEQACRTHSIWCQTMLRAAIFEKSLRLSPEERVAHPPEMIINMSVIDAEILGVYVLRIHELWSAPLQMIAIAFLLVKILGTSALWGFAMMLLVFLVGQGWVNKALQRTFVSYLTLNDRRLALLRELLYNLKGVKSLAYELVFRRLITSVRDDQIAALRLWLSIHFSYFIAVNLSVPALTAGAAFLVYYLNGNELTSAVVFPSLTYFGMLQQPISQISMAISRQFTTFPCLIRLLSLLEGEEAEISPPLRADDSTAAVQFDDASFIYPGSNSRVLQVGSLQIPRGQLTAIVGPTGAGKSSLLKAILGEMTPSAGVCKVFGSTAYAAQDPWIMSGTLRDNIVFADHYDSARYKKVIRMCGLDYDLLSFPGADQMQVGDAGSNLSGGERARISLARALYTQSDVLLLDDPLAAIDGNVRELLFETIRSQRKTVIIVMQKTTHLAQVDNIVLVEQHRVAQTGPVAEFLSDSRFYPGLGSATVGSGQPLETSMGKDSSDHERAGDARPPSQEEHSTPTHASVRVFDDEERAEGVVQFRVFKFYAQCVGGIWEVLAITFGVVLSIASKIMASYWFVWWIGDVLRLEKAQYMGGYLGITFSQTIIQAGLALVLVHGSIKASRQIHNTIIDNMLLAPLSFFEQHPVGRILNRLSLDMNLVDTRVMNGVDMALSALTAFIASLCLVASSSFITLFLLIPFVFFVARFQAQFRVCAREVQRSALILQSPTISILSEALVAPSSINIFDAVPFLIERHEETLDLLMSAQIVRKSLDTWLSLRVELVSTFLLLLLALLVVYGIIPGDMAGLALSTVMGIAKNVASLAWTLVELEIKMVPVERLKRYCDDIPQEDNATLAVRSIPPQWQSSSVIEMKDVTVQYTSRPSPGLDGISLHIKSGERVGIVGRTGSGKSTFLSAISRLVNITSGAITIDGINISTVVPQQLRSVVLTLSQEPLIFEGTLRENLDPENAHADTELVNALQLCQLKSLLSATHNMDPLSQQVKSAGAALSAGQRQLLCVARVLLDPPPILLIDEVTANVDHLSDAALQRAFQSLPCGTTIIAVAHRAASLSWMDRILVMEDGRITEDASPLALLQQATEGLEKEGDRESYYRAAVELEGEEALQGALHSAGMR